MSRPLDYGRYEYKYALPADARERIRDVSLPFVQPDPHAIDLGNGGSGYEVHSLYFDTPDLTDYYQRLGEHKVRNRLRARTYGRPGDRAPVFLENKRKLENWVIKHRVKVCDADQWCSGEYERPWTHFGRLVQGRKQYAASHFSRLVDGAPRVPVSVVHYVREVYVSRRKDQPRLRLTIDHAVSATVVPSVTDLYAPPSVDLIPQDWIVMELKFDGDRPGWMRTLCQKLRLRAVPVSKFGLSVAKGLRAGNARENRYLTPPKLRQLGWGL